MHQTRNRLRIGAAALCLAATMMAAGPADAFEPQLTAIVLGTAQPSVSGDTNLPDGSILVVAVARPESSYAARSQVAVLGGQFKTAPFTDNGKDLGPGKYAVTITMSMAMEQPHEVESVVGRGGAKLTGHLVKLGPFGIYVEQALSFTVGNK